MRYLGYFILTVLLCGAVVVGIAGLRGRHSRKPPLYIFPDMNRQLKLRPLTADSFFANGDSSQPHVPGTIARGKPIQTVNGPVYPYEDKPVNTGYLTGTTNYVPTNPLPITAELLARGQQRFQIYCSPCHSRLGDGNGITKRIGAMAVVGNLHDKRIVEMPDGEIFNVITHGRNLMGAYGPNVAVRDRWAVIAYVRALQLSWVASTNDVPPQLRAQLTK